MASGEFLLVRFLRKEAETAKAYLVIVARVVADPSEEAEIWLPKSQIEGFDEEARVVWVKRWLVEKKGLSFEAVTMEEWAERRMLEQGAPAPVRRIRVLAEGKQL